MNKRLQLNIRVEKEDLDAIEDIRRTMSPIPSASEVVRKAIQELRDRATKRGRK